MGGYNNYYDVSFVNDNCIGHDRIGYACALNDRRIGVCDCDIPT